MASPSRSSPASAVKGRVRRVKGVLPPETLAWRLELLRQGGSPATFFWDVRKTFDTGGEVPYTPENYDRKYHGPVRLRNALARSYNIPAVEALERAGIGNVIRLAHKLGITDLDRGLQFYGLALTLGGAEVKLLDMTYAYATMANGASMIGMPKIALPGILAAGLTTSLAPSTSTTSVWRRSGLMSSISNTWSYGTSASASSTFM
jgi:hypothetical protein